MKKWLSYLFAAVVCLLMLSPVSQAAGFLSQTPERTVLLAEIQSYGDYELKPEYFQTLADKLGAAIPAETPFFVKGRSTDNMTNEAGRHDTAATAEDAAISQIHMDAIVRGHQFNYGFAAAKLIRYADASVGRTHFYDDTAVKAWQNQVDTPYHLSPSMTDAARAIGEKYGARYLLFVNVRDVDVRLKHTMFATHTERATRGKKMKAALDYYLVDARTGRVYEGHCDNGKTAQMLNLAVAQWGKGMDVDAMLNEVMEAQAKDVADNLIRKGFSAMKADASEAKVVQGKPVIVLAGFQSRVSDVNNSIESGAMLPVVRETMMEQLSDSPAFTVKDDSELVTRMRMTEQALVQALGDGELQAQVGADADYIIYGYLTEFSDIKAQSGVLGVRGKDTTVHLELTMRVVDAHTGAVVFVTQADARRKSNLDYDVILSRHDKGKEDAAENALRMAAVNLADQFLRAAI